MPDPTPRAALTCPQCGGPLPRQAAWRMVACPYCRAIVTRGDRVVQREPFHDAWRRAQAASRPGPAVALGSRRWRLLQPAGSQPRGTLWWADSAGPPDEQALVRIGRGDDAALAAEPQALARLHQATGLGAAYYTRRLPWPLASGATTWNGQSVNALVLARPCGHWGSLAAVLDHHPQGLRDARHAVWLWRRVLELLGWLHGMGWTHGDLQPAHWWVHPGDHGVMLLGWHRAQPGGDPARDLMQSAWVLRQALAPAGAGAPVPRSDVDRRLADLLRVASEDAAWCRRQGAAGVDAHLRQAAQDAFGPPRFVPFDPCRA